MTSFALGRRTLMAAAAAALTFGSPAMAEQMLDKIHFLIPGGAGGGWLLGQYGDSAVYMVGAGMVAVWFLLAWSMKQPAYLQSVTLPLTQTGELDAGVWASRLMGVTGVEEAVVIEEERAAYLKVDNARLDREQLKQLSQLSMQSQAEPA